MTKLIAIFFVAVALFVGYRLFVYWDHVKNEEDLAKKREAAAAVVPEQLPGIPPQIQPQIENSLRAAQAQGVAAMRAWLKAYGATVRDPRKAWIDLDFCVMISRDNPAEARQIFADVKARTPESSPVWPRIKSLEKTYE
jgi:hypothetical protein